jgi:hypothetical protein
LLKISNSSTDGYIRWRILMTWMCFSGITRRHAGDLYSRFHSCRHSSTNRRFAPKS